MSDHLENNSDSNIASDGSDIEEHEDMMDTNNKIDSKMVEDLDRETKDLAEINTDQTCADCTRGEFVQASHNKLRCPEIRKFILRKIILKATRSAANASTASANIGTGDIKTNSSEFNGKRKRAQVSSASQTNSDKVTFPDLTLVDFRHVSSRRKNQASNILDKENNKPVKICKLQHTVQNQNLLSQEYPYMSFVRPMYLTPVTFEDIKYAYQRIYQRQINAQN
eukprot:TRINITY_DN14910_c0_g1_i1.p2 TRINITY_DN14910_c0_g1~~TRINITY_DN14910_c0_g1_i1.p2  ORF type:complete len:224 (-),score=22.15 TRINITY_DN14910_c0_g1_i1:335-1006(-)